MALAATCEIKQRSASDIVGAKDIVFLPRPPEQRADGAGRRFHLRLEPHMVAQAYPWGSESPGVFVEIGDYLYS